MCRSKAGGLEEWFPTFWVPSPGILFYEQCWSHVASKLSEVYHFGNFSGPTWTFFKSRYRYRSRWLGTSGLEDVTSYYFPMHTEENQKKKF